MGSKLLWIGLTLIVALNKVIEVFGGKGSEIVVVLGALLMVIGAVLYSLDK